MNAIEAYTLLHDACDILDKKGDHAIAAYVGLAMAMLADKYDIDAAAAGNRAEDGHAAYIPKPAAEGGTSWA